MSWTGFDLLAPHYFWLEYFSFGGLLRRTRAALLPNLAGCRRVLILGEGDGRFLEAFLLANPTAMVDCLDLSPGMTSLALARIKKIPAAESRVHFHLGDARQWNFPQAHYDLLVANFFLDCFCQPELAQLLERLAIALAPGGKLLVGDFHWPEGRLARAPARLALNLMYGFFKLFTGISAGKLVDPGPGLQALGFTRARQVDFLGGFLRSSLWSGKG